MNIWEKFESAPKTKGRGGVEAEMRPPRGFLGGPGPLLGPASSVVEASCLPVKGWLHGDRGPLQEAGMQTPRASGQALTFRVRRPPGWMCSSAAVPGPSHP